MADLKKLERPILVVVTGRPASGKTTLAHKLSHAIRCPLISRDEMKEGYVNTLRTNDTQDDDPNLHVYHTFFATVEFMLKRRISLVIEAAFQHKLWIPKLEPLLPIAHIRIILCSIDPELAKSRFIERNTSDPDRDGFHSGWSVAQQAVEKMISGYQAPQLDVPTLTVDTSNDYKPTLDEIASFALSPPMDAVQ